MSEHPIVSNEQWLAARIELLRKEKEFTRLRDELTAQRQRLPWRLVDKEYLFDGPEGQESLADLFGGCSQLIVYHFMFGPQWQEGCKVCTMLGEHYEPMIVHLQHRDVSLVTVSRAKLEALEQYKQRMGFRFKWVSSLENEFNADFHVVTSESEMEAGQTYYNYQQGAKFPVTELPGISSFYKDAHGQIYHTYSSYGRGLESFLGIYNFLDIVTKGRDEQDLPYPMAWVRHRDQYDDDTIVDPYV